MLASKVHCLTVYPSIHTMPYHTVDTVVMCTVPAVDMLHTVITVYKAYPKGSVVDVGTDTGKYVSLCCVCT